MVRALLHLVLVVHQDLFQAAQTLVVCVLLLVGVHLFLSSRYILHFWRLEHHFWLPYLVDAHIIHFTLTLVFNCNILI